MKTSTLSIQDVRAVCSLLVKHNGDCFEVATKTSIPLEVIRKIKDKTYMKSISDTYFTSDQWNPRPGVREPDRITLTSETTEPEKAEETKTTEPVKTEEQSAKKQRLPLTEQVVENICKMIGEGKTPEEIVNATGVSKSSIFRIKTKKSHTEISDKYFHIDDTATTTTTTTTTAAVDKNGMIDELYNIIQTAILNKKMSELPDELLKKIIPILDEYTDSLSIKEIKELI